MVGGAVGWLCCARRWICGLWGGGSGAGGSGWGLRVGEEVGEVMR